MYHIKYIILYYIILYYIILYYIILYYIISFILYIISIIYHVSYIIYYLWCIMHHISCTMININLYVLYAILHFSFIISYTNTHTFWQCWIMLWRLGLDFCKVMWRFGQIQTAAILLFGSFSESKTRFVIPRYCLGLLADLCLHWSLVVSSQTATMVLWADGSLVGDLCYHWRGVPRTGSAEASCSRNGRVGHGKSHPFLLTKFLFKTGFVAVLLQDQRRLGRFVAHQRSKEGRTSAHPCSHRRCRFGRRTVRPTGGRHHLRDSWKPGKSAALAWHGGKVHHQQSWCKSHLVAKLGAGRDLLNAIEKDLVSKDATKTKVAKKTWLVSL